MIKDISNYCACVPSKREFSAYNYVLSFYGIEWGLLRLEVKPFLKDKYDSFSEIDFPTFVLENNLLGRKLEDCVLLYLVTKDYTQ